METCLLQLIRNSAWRHKIFCRLIPLVKLHHQCLWGANVSLILWTFPGCWRLSLCTVLLMHLHLNYITSHVWGKIVIQWFSFWGNSSAKLCSTSQHVQALSKIFCSNAQGATASVKALEVRCCTWCSHSCAPTCHTSTIFPCCKRWMLLGCGWIQVLPGSVWYVHSHVQTCMLLVLANIVNT